MPRHPAGDDDRHARLSVVLAGVAIFMLFMALHGSALVLRPTQDDFAATMGSYASRSAPWFLGGGVAMVLDALLPRRGRPWAATLGAVVVTAGAVATLLTLPETGWSHATGLFAIATTLSGVCSVVALVALVVHRARRWALLSGVLACVVPGWALLWS